MTARQTVTPADVTPQDRATDVARRYGATFTRPLKIETLPGLVVRALPMPPVYGEPATYLVVASAPDGLVYGANVVRGATAARADVRTFADSLRDIVR